ncbi:hypothetical protein [Actinoplanes ianthinogenes]|uniref:hypothetical protein n=1 Tax=Actinoplanes ianthinogenes TaxID=122358 RepID=UPI001670ECBB|nr:hypothetical protein [Actinoplanes ianthinogenes]
MASGLVAAVRGGRSSPDEVLDLLGTVHRRIQADPVFREEARQLVVAAYADPSIAPMLPDPSPGL